MKTIIVLIGLLLLIFFLVQLFALYTQWNIETYPHTVIKKYPNFEVRAYDASLFTAVKLGGSRYKEVSGRGFSILAGYIFGGNERKEKIAMTSPVAMTLDDSMTMMFMVPSKYDKTTLPRPNQSSISFKEEPAKR